jgi:hypothetical protein
MLDRTVESYVVIYLGEGERERSHLSYRAFSEIYPFRDWCF